MTSYSHPQAHHLRRQVCLWTAVFPPSHPLQLFQDYSQFTRDSGNKGNKVNGEQHFQWASGWRDSKDIAGAFWKGIAEATEHDHHQREKSTSISTQMDSLIPASKRLSA